MTERPDKTVPAGMTRNCSIAATLEVLADKWAFLVVREAFFGAKRFNEFAGSLQCSRATLSRTLQDLIAAGIFTTNAVSTSGSWKEYVLTEAGLDLYQVFLSLLRFGDRWLWQGIPPLALFHLECRSWLTVSTVWRANGTRIDPHEVSVVLGEDYWIPATPQTNRSRRGSSASGPLSVRPDSVEKALAIIGDRWTFLVLREMFHGNHRFDEFAKNIGVASNILSDRLKTLTSSEIVTRSEDSRPYYRLSEAGLALYPSMLHMKQWGDIWRHDGHSTLTLRHNGAADTVELVCAECSRPVHPHAVTYLASYQPATPFPRAGSASATGAGAV